MLFPPLIPLTAYVAVCWLIGHLGRNCKFAFWGNFWISIVLTPIIGLVVLLAQDHSHGKKTLVS